MNRINSLIINDLLSTQNWLFSLKLKTMTIEENLDINFYKNINEYLKKNIRQSKS